MANLNLRNPAGYSGTLATQFKQGIVRFATLAEAAAGEMDNVAITPATAQAATVLDFASPPTLGFGSTTPRPVAATTLTTSGDYTASGNVIINGAAKQLRVHGGAVTDFIGTATLVAGTVTIANTNIAATDRIFVQRTTANASTALGVFSYAISAGATFTITSRKTTDATAETNDVSTVTYFIVRQV